jgi:FkbM family methyltransferase
MNIKSKLKQFLRASPFLVKIKRKIWRVIFANPAALTDSNYFKKQFFCHKNFKSLSFDKGVVQGAFRETSFLLKIHPQNLIETNIFLNGMWEPHIAELIASYLNCPNSAVIDVGANVGATSIPLAKHFNEVRFFLFEPHPIVFNDLKNNVSFNNLSNVEAYNFAITNIDQEFLPFYAQRKAHNFGLSSFNLNHDIEDYDVIQVQCKPLDSIFDNKLELKIIKIDTQGHELNVLLSAKQLISKHRPIVLFEFESEYFKDKNIEFETKEKLVTFFKQLNYELFMITQDSKFYPKLTLKDYFHGDILAVPLFDSKKLNA